MKGVRNAEKRQVGKKGKECGSAKLWSFKPPGLQPGLKVRNGAVVHVDAHGWCHSWNICSTHQIFLQRLRQ